MHWLQVNHIISLFSKKVKTRKTRRMFEKHMPTQCGLDTPIFGFWVTSMTSKWSLKSSHENRKGLSWKNKIYLKDFWCKLDGLNVICKLTTFLFLDDLNDHKYDLLGQSKMKKMLALVGKTKYIIWAFDANSMV